MCTDRMLQLAARYKRIPMRQFFDIDEIICKPKLSYDIYSFNFVPLWLICPSVCAHLFPAELTLGILLQDLPVLALRMLSLDGY